ncbi:lithocholate 6-beta-hydroxylase-like [Galendromus occidentalis]|uniref:Lithocholate 6-beta-hydroxylase-like n=1 Tax=Galendromus occidentalis TaxID=34638 RepID=A0AAJ6QW49_9ACAR|nr:lithocholate 6-beta-hydroxylase-like [Galendromus occidentalis]
MLYNAELPFEELLLTVSLVVSVFVSAIMQDRTALRACIACIYKWMRPRALRELEHQTRRKVSYKTFQKYLETANPEFANRVLRMKELRPTRERALVKMHDLLFREPEICDSTAAWSEVHASINQAFSESNSRGSIEKCGEIADRHVRLWRTIEQDLQSPYDLYRSLTGFSTDAMMYAVHGMNLRLDADLRRLPLKHINDLKEAYCSSVGYPTQRTGRNVGVDGIFRATKYFNELATKVMDRFRGQNNATESEGNGCPFLKHLLTSQESGSAVDQLAGPVSLLLVLIGAEATAYTLNVCLYFLAKTPTVQDRMRREILSILGDRTKIEFGDLERMKYVESVILETLRLAPLHAKITRYADADGKVGDISFKKGMPIEIDVTEMSRDAKNFPEPLLFRPERFCDPDVRRKQRMEAFLAFGSGTGSCPAREFSMYLMKSFLAQFCLKLRAVKTPKTPACAGQSAPELSLAYFLYAKKFVSHRLLIGIQPVYDDFGDDHD